jgi:hypothetical protein
MKLTIIRRITCTGGETGDIASCDGDLEGDPNSPLLPLVDALLLTVTVDDAFAELPLDTAIKLIFLIVLFYPLTLKIISRNL